MVIKMRREKPELLVPASSLEVLKTAVIFGADAVYIGGEAFGLRAKAKNFSMEDMAAGIAFAHEHGVKVYVTANILAHNDDLEGARAYFNELKEMKPDALIISDPGMFMIAKEVCPEIEIHISTQANNTNYQTYLFWWQQGARRVVSARELSLKEIAEIRKHIPDEMEIENPQLWWPNGLGEQPLYQVQVDLKAGDKIVPIPAVGSMLWWKRPDPENICRSMRMREVPISSTPRICA